MQNNQNTIYTEILTCLNSLIEHSFLEGDAVLIPKENVKIVPFISSFKDRFVSIGFEVHHQKFDKPFVDMSAGVGETISDAIHNAVKSFLVSAFCGVRHLINGEYHHKYQNIFCGEQKKWYVSESCIASMGADNNVPDAGYWSLIKDHLFDHLGNKKYYIIKIYASKQNSGEITCECRINGFVSHDISQKLSEFVESWEVTMPISSNKQFFFIEQSEETYKEYPYTFEEIADFTASAARIIVDRNKDGCSDSLLADIHELTNDFSLAVELHSFIPEICAERAFSEIEYDEHMTVMYNDDNKPLIGKDQFASYRWIQEGLFNAFDEKKLTNDDYGVLISASAIYSVIRSFQEKSGNDDLSSLRLASLIMSVDECYNIR